MRAMAIVECILLCFLLCTLFVVGCNSNHSNVFAETLEGPCQGLYGLPSANTGLDSDRCKPSCTCGNVTWAPPKYDATWSEPLLKWKLTNPPALLKEDPYNKPAPKSPKGTVCAMLPAPNEALTYSLKTYPGVQEAEAAGARVTHFGPCGQCSSLQNLHVYMTKTDLTGPVRSCAIKGLGGNDKAALKCLEEIGFDQPCAQIWFYNTTHTRQKCLSKCLLLLESPHHTKDGKLNECIQCDEDKSGDVFKAISGRTRRNSGLPSALCRPPESVRPITHDYGNRKTDGT